MNSIIQYLLIQNQYLLQIISFLFKFICKYIPLRQWIFDDSNSPLPSLMVKIITSSIISTVNVP